ncbi:actinodin1 isoform X1 [Oncorhynchus clarkii lewisi]|uniref:actinodin1 isoform X1 n=1 Tax=Oncorhynchus clarkii lewisi TaxID=490388 RepID=UPI0039B9A6CD
MAGRSRTSFSGVLTAALLATILLPEFLSAGPVLQKLNGQVGDATEETAVAMASARRLVRNRRNISWYKQHSDFWSWYKYFTDNGNTEAVQELDRVYLAYLQNKNRAEGRRSYKAYLGHLGDIYKACADSEDPNCVASATSRQKPETPKAPPKPAPVKACDSYRDPYCLYAAKSQPPPSPGPVKAPAPNYVRSPVAVKEPHSGYYSSPAVQPFLSKEQKAELLRICSAEDVDCLQYHLRAAFGHNPSAGPMPSYAHLGCDPKDPTCKPQLVQKAPSGLFLRYPNCDPRDPRCAYAASLQAPRAPAPPAPAGPGSCNPLFEDGCNPLTATKYATAPEEFKEEHKDEPAAMRAAPPAPEQRSDPFAMYRDAYANANGNRQGSAPSSQAGDPYTMFGQGSALSAQASDPYAMYRQGSAPSAQASDPYAMYHQGSAPSAQASDPYAMYHQGSAPSAQASDPYAMYRQSSAPRAQASDPYAMYRQGSALRAQASDPYAMYRQASSPSAPAIDPYAMYRRAIASAQANDPYTMYRQANANDPLEMYREAAASMHRHVPPSPPQQAPASPPRYEEPTQEDRHPLGPRGRTKEGYECFIGYDQECYPIARAEPRSGVHRNTAYPAEPYEPHLNADGSRNGVLEPSDPDCDPEYDTNCRLRRYEPREDLLPDANAQAVHQGEPQHSRDHSYNQGEPERESEADSEPYQSGQEETYGAYPPPSQGLSYRSYPSTQQGMPSFQDMLRGYRDQYPEQDNHRAYAADYRQK